MELWDDKESGCYRVTCRDGWCFDLPDERGQNGLHELISDYTWTDVTKAEALQHARSDFREHEKHVEQCNQGPCEWCRPED